jgi:hypothetical protein
VKVRLVLADTGRLLGSAVSLLNAGWTATTAVALPAGGWTLPGQAVAVFLEASWDELNKPYTLKLELVDDEGKLVQFARPDGVVQEVRIAYSVIMQPVPGAPNGTPGNASVLVDLVAGSLRISAPRHRYIWRAGVDEDDQAKDEIGFWVNGPLQQPVIGGLNLTGPS